MHSIFLPSLLPTRQQPKWRTILKKSWAGTEARNLYIGTFHSVFARILRAEANKIGYPNNFTIYDTDDAKSVVKTVINELNLDDKTL